MSLLNDNNLEPLDPNMPLRKSWVLYKWPICQRQFYWVIKLTDPTKLAETSEFVKDEQTRNPRDIGIIFHRVANHGWDKVTLHDMQADPYNTMMSAFSHSNSEVNKRLLNFITVELKRWELLTNKNWFMPYWREKFYEPNKHGMFGTSDRGDQIGEREFAIIDYKTGKYKDEIELILELTWYAMMADDYVPGKVTVGVMFFPHVHELTNFIFYHKFVDEDYTRVYAHLKVVRDDMKANIYERTTNVKTCRQCDFYGKHCIGPRRV